MKFSGANLRRARLGISASQVRFAVMLGISERTLQRYETGAAVPDADLIAEVARITSRPLEFLYVEDVPPAF